MEPDIWIGLTNQHWSKRVHLIPSFPGKEETGSDYVPRADGGNRNKPKPSEMKTKEVGGFPY